MAKPEFSETQFAFAFFHYFISKLSKKTTFIFPTLFQEGDYEGNYGGSDLIINSNVFIQFKTSEYFIYANTTEINNNSIDKKFLPYYRFNLKNSPESFQYNKLKETAHNKSNFVCYIAPLFHTNSEFSTYFNSNKIIENSIYYNLKDFRNINIEENDTHIICYKKSGESYICSEPIIIQSYNFDKEIFPFDFIDVNENDVSYQEVFNQISEIFNIPDTYRNNFRDIQNYLIIRNNVFWIPIIKTN